LAVRPLPRQTLRVKEFAKHPYRDAFPRTPPRPADDAFDTTLLFVQVFLVLWSMARIVFDVSCARIDLEGLVALTLCGVLVPHLIRRPFRR
jgi:hypothetical protein